MEHLEVLEQWWPRKEREMFSRKHYVAIAGTLKELNSMEGAPTMVDVVHAFSDLLGGLNDSFNEKLFVEACGFDYDAYLEGAYAAK